jgi:hypothetical protein
MTPIILSSRMIYRWYCRLQAAFAPFCVEKYHIGQRGMLTDNWVYCLTLLCSGWYTLLCFSNLIVPTPRFLKYSSKINCVHY